MLRQYNGKKIVLSANGAGTTEHPHAENKEISLDKNLMGFTKINSK